MDRAAEGGHLSVVEWLHANRPEGCSIEAMDRAAGQGHLSIVEWLHANRSEGCSTEAIDSAAESGHLSMVEWLLGNSPFFDPCVKYMYRDVTVRSIMDDHKRGVKQRSEHYTDLRRGWS